MARRPLPVGTWGNIARTEIEPGHWMALARVRDADGVTRRVKRYSPPGKPDRTGARAEAELVDELTERGRTGDIDANTRVAHLWIEYRRQLVEDDRSSGTLDGYDHIAVRINDGLGQLTIGEASTQRLDRFLRTLGDRHGKSVAAKARVILGGMFKLAVRYGAVSSNPMADVKTISTQPKKRPRSMDVDLLATLLTDVRTSALPCPELMTPSEAAKRNGRGVRHTPPTVADYCDEADLADVITLFAATGLRIGELLGVRWIDVDLEAATLSVSGKVVRIRGAGMVREDFTKTAAGTRVVPLPGFALSVLRARRLVHGIAGHGLVFPSTAGTLRDPDTVSRQWRRVRAALDLEWVTSHTFRKTVATILDTEGLSAREAADQLGHANVSMTTDVYFGRGRTHTRVAEVLDRAVSQSVPLTSREAK